MTAPDPSASAGILGFLAFFLLGLALYLLMRSMGKRIQHIEYDRRDQELHAGEADGPVGGPPPERRVAGADALADTGAETATTTTATTRSEHQD